LEPHSFTAVVSPCFSDIPPKHPRQNAAGLSLAFILGFSAVVFCEGGIKITIPSYYPTDNPLIKLILKSYEPQ